MSDYKISYTVIRINEEDVKLQTVTDKYKRVWVELDKLLDSIKFDDKNKLIKNKIPSCYIKRYEVNKKKIKMIDQLAITYVLKEVNNYDLYKTITNRLLDNQKHYNIQLFSDTMKELHSKMSCLEKLKNKISIYDAMQQDILHNLEKEDLTSEEMLKLAEELKNLREERRVVKNQYHNLNLINRFF